MKWLTKEVVYAFSLLSYFGIVMIGNILVCIGIYKLIEKYYKESTFLFIIFILLGVASGFFSIYKLIMKK